MFTNPRAKSWTYKHDVNTSLAQKFHRSLPDFEATPLVAIDEVAHELGVHKVFVKDESNRLGLTSFKILGASWGVFRAIAARGNLPLDSSLEDVSRAAQALNISLFSATAGNHGRAVARMAKLLQIPATIFVPKTTDDATQQRIAGEGAEVLVVQGDYDAAVAQAWHRSHQTEGGLLVQDNAFDGYEEIPAWIIEGYSGLMQEVEQQLAEQGLTATIMVTAIGVGSLGHAVVAHCKSRGRGIAVLAVEPENAACLHQSLRDQKMTTVQTSRTIMDGMNAGTVSPISWETLRAGVDASITVSDIESHQAVQYLQTCEVNAGPCGAATLAAIRKAAQTEPAAMGLDESSIVVLLSTEGARPYPLPPSQHIQQAGR